MGAFLRGLELKMLKKAGIVTITKKKFSIPIRGVGPQNGHQALHMSSHQPSRGRISNLICFYSFYVCQKPCDNFPLF